MTPLLMALAGGLGAGSRYSIDAWLRPRTSARLPWPTLVVNVSGSFLLGLLIGLAPGDPWVTILGTGFLGGYTTFSTASAESVQLLADGRHAASAAHALGMLVLCVAAAAAGHLLAGLG